MAMVVRVLRHEVLFYGGALSGQLQADVLDKVRRVRLGVLKKCDVDSRKKV